MKLLGAQRRRETAKPLQFLELMKATFDCGGNVTVISECEASRRKFARWVSAAWKAIPESIIVRSFTECCISNDLDGSKDDIIWEDNVKDKDDSDWVESTDNDSVMSDDGKSDE
jgi:hypothetical protein